MVMKHLRVLVFMGSIIHQDGGTEKMWFIESNQDGESGDVPLEICVITRYL